MNEQSDAPRFLQVELLSEAAFSRGEGTAGMVEMEVEHDPWGVPFVGGRTLRGLLRDSWLSMARHFPELKEAALRVLGRSRTLDERCCLRIGDALLPSALRRAARRAVERDDNPLSAHTILEGLTAVRHQTAEERISGAPAETTLRSCRVMLRGLEFHARLHWLEAPRAEDLQVLALCALATRHGGLARNRGRGHLRLTLEGDLACTRSLAGLERKKTS